MLPQAPPGGWVPPDDTESEGDTESDSEMELDDPEAERSRHYELSQDLAEMIETYNTLANKLGRAAERYENGFRPALLSIYNKPGPYLTNRSLAEKLMNINLPGETWPETYDIESLVREWAGYHSSYLDQEVDRWAQLVDGLRRERNQQKKIMQKATVGGEDCGDSVLQGDESCDDGGVSGGDGCSSSCEMEPGYMCEDLSDSCEQPCEAYDWAGNEAQPTARTYCDCSAFTPDDGYTVSKDCVQSDIDECALETSNCDSIAICTNLPGSFNCTCPQGYYGNGLQCVSTGYLVSARVEVETAAATEAAWIAHVSSVLFPHFSAASTASTEDTQSWIYTTFTASENAGKSMVYYAMRLGSTWVNQTELDALVSEAKHTDFDTEMADGAPGDVSFVSYPLAVVDVASGALDTLQLISSGFQLLSVDYNPGKFAWELKAKYNPEGEDAIDVLYIMRAVAPYTADEERTFQANEFPCMTSDSLCCVNDVVTRYRTLTTFEDYLQTAPIDGVLGQCPARPSNHTSAVMDTTRNFMIGNFSGTKYSFSKVGTAADIVDITLDVGELRTLAGIQETQTGGYKVDFFIGTAHISALNTNALATDVSQVRITGTIINNLAFTTSGVLDYSFLEDIKLSIHQTKYIESDIFTRYPQYVRMQMALPPNLEADPILGLVPLTSIRVAKGTFYDTATFFPACYKSATGTEDGLFDTVANIQMYDNALSQQCSANGPAACKNPPISTITAGKIEIVIPLGDSFFGDADYSGAAKDTNIFVDFTVATREIDSGRRTTSQVKAQAPLTDAADVVRHCETEEPESELDEALTIDIFIGTTDDNALWDTQIQEFKNIADPNRDKLRTNALAVSSPTPAGAFMTVLIRGVDDVFKNPRAVTFSTEIEDVISLFFLNKAEYDSVAALIAADNAFEIIENPENADRPRLQLKSGVTSICPLRPTAGYLSCGARRDIDNRVPYSGIVHEVTPQNKTEAGEFMQGILGQTDFARDLGTGFSDLLSTKYGLNNRYKRAWWISPLYDWSSAMINPDGGATNDDVRSLYQRSLSFFLVSMDENGGPSGRRRSRRLLQIDSGDSLDAAKGKEIQLPGSVADEEVTAHSVPNALTDLATTVASTLLPGAGTDATEADSSTPAPLSPVPDQLPVPQVPAAPELPTEVSEDSDGMASPTVPVAPPGGSAVYIPVVSPSPFDPEMPRDPDEGANRRLLQVGAAPPQTTGFGLKTGLNSAIFNQEIDPIERIMSMTNMKTSNTLALKGAVLLKPNEACQSGVDLHRTMQDKARAKLKSFTSATGVLVAAVNVDPAKQAQACAPAGRRLLQAANTTVEEVEGSITIFFTFAITDNDKSFDVLKAFEEMGLIKLVDQGNGKADVVPYNAATKTGWFYDKANDRQYSYEVLDQQPDTIIEYRQARSNMTWGFVITIIVLVLLLIFMGIYIMMGKNGEKVESADEEA